MSFDIYGENLAVGHCEVHPWVHAEYPCPVCLSDSNKRRSEKLEEERYYREMEAAYYAEMAGSMEYDSWCGTTDRQVDK